MSKLPMQDNFKLSKEAKSQIKKAQQRLRRAPDFMKKIADQQGGKVSTAGSYDEVVRNYERAKWINDDSAFTNRGFKAWQNQIMSEAKVGRKELNYVLSKIDLNTMTFIQGSPLKYGTNPQLDYIMDSAIQLYDEMRYALAEIETYEADIEELTDLLF